MSIKTDLASLEIIAEVHRSQDIRKTFIDMVHTLQNQVSYFDWVGVYLFHGENMILEAASDMESHLSWECNAEIRIPIKSAHNKEMGKIVVRSREHICFDITDISTLETLANEISQKLFIN